MGLIAMSPMTRVMGALASRWLRCLGAREIACTIGKHNVASMRLHEGCAFVATDELPLGPWGELEEGSALWWRDPQMYRQRARHVSGVAFHVKASPDMVRRWHGSA